eukprot:TRINITY_DN41834_c0_g1_i1.p1 TRINITY_DN41834_c0_g1~~TRINITY_DN41834_c0_g1_i1.p1  ORF type:complete len:617 (+),score=75.95 TRINITY_DN41834_c0_g1_i1:108-1958(+)
MPRIVGGMVCDNEAVVVRGDHTFGAYGPRRPRRGVAALACLVGVVVGGVHGQGDPTCWDETMGSGFLLCCATRIFGEGGNPECWDEARLVTFQRCCVSPSPSEVEANELLDKAQADFNVTITAFARLLHRLELERHAFGERRLSTVEAWLLQSLGELLTLWRADQMRELVGDLRGVLARMSKLRHRSETETLRERRVGILTACTPDTAGSDMCRLGANLWQCYAQRHGYHFILDTNPYPVGPHKYRFRSPRSDEKQHTALDAEFDADAFSFLDADPMVKSLGTDGLDFKWWQRWYAARRHLPFYDILLVVDPDTSVFPSCFDVGLPEALGLSRNGAFAPPENIHGDVDGEDEIGVLTRDARVGEDTNGGVFVLGGGPWGFLFLELLLARSRWPIDVAGGSGWCHARQSAEFETFIEVVALERAWRFGNSDNGSSGDTGSDDGDSDADVSAQFAYSSECMKHAVPQAVSTRSEEAPIAGCTWPEYRTCWNAAMSRLAGDPGSRSDWMRYARLLDPGVVDINYRPWSNELRYKSQSARSQPDAPIIRSAFIWHYVAIPNKTSSMMRDFGLKGLEDTFDCQTLQHIFNRRWAFSGCMLSGSSSPCPHGDSDLMPRAWGC